MTGDMNNRGSSVKAYAKDIVLYDKHGYKGCSLLVQRQKYIRHLGTHNFCNPVLGWSNRTSSVKILN